MGAGTVRADRQYASWIVGGILLVVLAGFSRSFFLLPVFGSQPHWGAKEPLYIFHGFVFSSWFALLAVQTYLIRARSIRLHRRLGYAGICLAAAIVVVGMYAALHAANRPTGFTDVPIPPDQFLIVPVSDITLFAVFFGLAVAFRKQSGRHKRFMLLASISLLDAPIARLPLMMPALPSWTETAILSVMVIAMAIWDYDSRGRVRPETLVGGATIVLLNHFALDIGAQPAWLQVSHALMGMAKQG